MKKLNIILAAASLLALLQFASAQTKLRARDLGIPFEGTPGALNAITDVKGIEVGHTTLISGEGKLQVGVGPVRTGVTTILPRGKQSTNDPVFAGWFSLNGNGEMTGTTWVEESGFLEGPIAITNTHSVGLVRDAVISWHVKHSPPDSTGYWWSLPIVAETYDGFLNDINGFHVKPNHVFEALIAAETMTGIDNHKVIALPHDRLKQVMRKYNETNCACLYSCHSADTARLHKRPGQTRCQTRCI